MSSVWTPIGWGKMGGVSPARLRSGCLLRLVGRCHQLGDHRLEFRILPDQRFGGRQRTLVRVGQIAETSVDAIVHNPTMRLVVREIFANDPSVGISNDP